jgi:hypothetical protein
LKDYWALRVLEENYSPVFANPKKNGTIRVVIGIRKEIKYC